ncbi:MAG: UDP-N-acetylmuramoyl-L-alanine--D-glutamate ligase, partial [Candidatus Caldatribacterium sp.]|nr:UDP-N-acetylmuramoyl-L-alanine--D-glutamate ligase [Candidatus Caldatribacterium sp.]
YLVMGLGRTGRAVLRFLLRTGERVYVSDDCQNLPADVAGNPLLTFVAPCDVEKVLSSIKECVVSPGIHPTHPVIRLLEERGIPVISEIELASRYISFPLIGITGSCGKSTTVSLIGEVVRLAGYRAFVGGNLGTPLIESLMDDVLPEVGVVELSSFQLERVYTARFSIAGMLNLYPNHLDYHVSMEAYFRAKGRILLNQRFQDWSLFLFSSSPWQARWCQNARGQVLPLAVGMRLFEGLYVLDDAIWQGGTPSRVLLSLEGCSLLGDHNRGNVLMAVAVSWLLGIPKDVIEKAIRSFRGLPHRLEFVGEWQGIKCYNDSKSTTPSSTRAAIEALPGPLVVILGGKAKLHDFSELTRALIPEKIRCVILYGASRDVIAQSLPPWVERYLVTSLQEAVEIAWREARKGDTILLSPACTSWDAYENFEARGEHFKELVRLLGTGTSSHSA